MADEDIKFPDPITGRNFIRAAIHAGLVPPTTNRIVLEANVEEALVVYAEQYGEEGWVQILPSRTDIELIVIPHEGGEDA